jgi:NitT/TauT family transport system substrate-binding protein
MRLVSARDRARRGGAIGRPGRRAVGVTAAAAGLLFVAGCHASSAAEPTGSGTVTVAAPTEVADTPLFIGMKDGLFRQAGLTVRVIPSTTVKSEVSALGSGQADIAFGDYPDMFYAQQLKTSPHLNIVANGYDAASSVMEVLVLPHSGITSVKSLRGKVIGTPEPQELPDGTSRGQPYSHQPYSLETIATWSVLSSDNVDPTKINWLPMPTSSLIPALKSGRVDAILATEPTIYQAESQLGAVPLLDSCTGATANLPLEGYFSDAAYAKQHAANLAAFRAALLKAQADGSNSAPVQSALMKYDHLPLETASLVTLGTYPTSLQEPDLQRVANLMTNLNILPQVTLSVPGMIAPR